jgi:hypothetical protein
MIRIMNSDDGNTVTTGSPTRTTQGSRVIYTFTGSGTITF